LEEDEPDETNETFVEHALEQVLLKVRQNDAWQGRIRM